MTSKSANTTLSLSLMTLVFFILGMLTCLNDLLAPHLKEYFSLNYAQTMLIQFCFFLTYAVMSLPMSKVVERIGYKFGVVLGLLIAALGCLLFVPAAVMHLYSFFLFGLFVLATGIVCLQVTANTYVIVLGEARYAPSRLTFVQAMNSVGTTLVPLVFGRMIVGGTVIEPYTIIAICLVLFSFALCFYPFPKIAIPPMPMDEPRSGSIWRNGYLLLGALAIFLYVGAEVSTGTILVNYLNLPQIANLPRPDAAGYLAFFWGGALVGRLIGSAVLRIMRPQSVIAFNCFVNISLISVSLWFAGHVAMWAILGMGLFNSIMFPTIFAIALDAVPRLKNQAAGLLCTAIAGGAIIPELQGLLADRIGLQYSFVLLIFCYLYIFYFVMIKPNKKFKELAGKVIYVTPS
ncbi:MAG: sugar MFS transporter [Gammaproteobacteria bacterium]|nr:sugar MFS transporter [Gammaproteobacteria bacterium]